MNEQIQLETRTGAGKLTIIMPPLLTLSDDDIDDYAQALGHLQRMLHRRRSHHFNKWFGRKTATVS